MANKLRSVLTAVAVTVLVTEITAVTAFVSAFLTLSSGELLLEAWGLIAQGWGSTHQVEILIAAGAVTVLASAPVAVLFYRRAVTTERTFEREGRR